MTTSSTCNTVHVAAENYVAETEMKMVFWSWFVGVISLQFRLWKRRVLLHSLCNSREVLRWIRSQRSGKMSGRSCLTFLHMKMLLIFCQIVMNRISGRLRFCMSCFIFLCQRRQRDNLLLLGDYLGL
nr:hypothetical protein CFP56_56351 [Quercus suber]